MTSLSRNPTVVLAPPACPLLLRGGGGGDGSVMVNARRCYPSKQTDGLPKVGISSLNILWVHLLSSVLNDPSSRVNLN